MLWPSSNGWQPRTEVLSVLYSLMQHLKIPGRIKQQIKAQKNPHLQSIYKELIVMLSSWSHWDMSPKKSDKGILVSSKAPFSIYCSSNCACCFNVLLFPVHVSAGQSQVATKSDQVTQSISKAKSVIMTKDTNEGLCLLKSSYVRNFLLTAKPSLAPSANSELHLVS